MKGKKWLSLLIVLSMVVSFLPLAAAATNYNDTQEHWAKAEIAKWSDLGILQGSGDLFRPSAPITRGEMAIILDRVMKYQEEALNAFSDLGQSWYTDAVLKANAAGIIKGDGNTVRPTDNITREEAAVMLGRALGLEEVSGNTSFGDNASISSWAKGYVSAMASKGFVGGVGANQFSPKANITRAEIVKLIDNAVKGFYTTASTHSGTVNGTAIVNADGATLKDMTINGDLIIAEGVGDGEVTLNNVKVTGQTIVRGGGENSVIVTGNSSLGKVIVDKKSDGTVSVKVTGNAKVDVVVAENGAINVSGTFSQLDIKGDVDVSLVNAKVDAVNVESKSIVVVDKASVVKTVAVAASSANVQVSGTVTTVTTTKEATNTKIETTSTAKITNVVAQAQGTTITGSGAITTVKAEANNVAVSTPNTKVEAGKGTTGVTAGGTTVSGGSSSTTNNSGTGSTTTPPSGGGGGGGGGSTTVRVGSVSVGTPTADGTGSGEPNIGKYTVGAVTGTTPNYATVITANKALVDVTSANAQQGTAKWVGILITTDREVNTLAVKTDMTFANLTNADIDEAHAAGATGKKTFVWWLKSNEMEDAKTIAIKVQGQADTTAVNLSATFVPYIETPDTTKPVLGKVTFEKNAEGNYVLTVNATDAESGLASLEVDHSLEGTLPEFTLGTVGESYDGEEFADLSGTSYTFADGVWTVYFNANATHKIIDKANGSITFYFSIKDVAGNQFGDMYNVTDEMTKTFDTTAPTLASQNPITINFEDNKGTTQQVTTGGTVYFTEDDVVSTIEVTLTEAVEIIGEISVTAIRTGNNIENYASVQLKEGNAKVLVITPSSEAYKTLTTGGPYKYQLDFGTNGSIKDAVGNDLKTTEITLNFEAAPIVTIADKADDALVTYSLKKDEIGYSGLQARAYMTTEEKAKILDGDKVCIKLFNVETLLGESSSIKPLGSIFTNTYAEQDGYASTLFYVGEAKYPSSSWDTTIYEMSKEMAPNKMVFEYIRNGVVIDTVEKESNTLVNDSFTDGISQTAISWKSLFVPSLVGATLTADDQTGNLILTIQTTDAERNWASLEVDHSVDALPEFTLTTERVELGDDTGNFKGVVSDFDNGTWTVNFNEYASDLIRANTNGKMTFYFVIRDEAGNQFGDMFNVTEEMTVELDVPPLSLKHRISLVPVDGDEAPTVGSAAHNIASALKDGQISVNDNVVSVSGTLAGEYDPWNSGDDANSALWFNIRLKFPDALPNGTYTFQYGTMPRKASINRKEGSTHVRIILSKDDAKDDGFELGESNTGMMKLAFDWDGDGYYDDEVFYVDMSGVVTETLAEPVE